MVPVCASRLPVLVSRTPLYPNWVRPVPPDLRKVPELWKQGGYSPMVDHAVPPDVPFAHFKYYLDLVNEICRNG